MGSAPSKRLLVTEECTQAWRCVLDPEGKRRNPQQQPLLNEEILAIWSCAELSTLIYSPPEDLGARLRARATQLPWFRPQSYSIVDMTLQDLLPAALVRFNRFSVVVIRGSQTMDDWLSNMNASPETFLGHRLHAGFAERARAIPLQMLLHHEFSDGRQGSIYVTGHSLGGAAATVSSLRCMLTGAQGQERIRVVTFGQPSVMSAAASGDIGRLGHRFVRFFHPNDRVPFLPHTAGFDHCFETLVRLPVAPPAPGATVSFTVQSPSDLVLSQPQWALRAHSMQETYKPQVIGPWLKYISPTAAAGASTPTVTQQPLPPSITSILGEFNEDFHSGKVSLTVKGTGVNVEFIRCTLETVAGSGPVMSISNKGVDPVLQYEIESGEENIYVECFKCIFEISESTYDAGAFILTASNSFQTVKKRFKVDNMTNVVFVGEGGMGKTHLIRALRVFADSGTLIDEFATTYARVATSDEVETFSLNRVHFRELPAFLGDQQQHQEFLTFFERYPPAMICIVYSLNAKVAVQGREIGMAQFVANVKMANENARNAGIRPVRLLVVITCCYAGEATQQNAAAASYAANLHMELELPADASIIFVNSAHHTIGPHSFPAWNVPQVYEEIMSATHVDATGLPLIRLRGWWRTAMTVAWAQMTPEIVGSAVGSAVGLAAVIALTLR